MTKMTKMTMIAPDDAPSDVEEKIRRLTPRQCQVAQLIALGLTNGEIATQLGAALKTVDSHRSSVINVLAVRNNVGICRFAIKAGLVDLAEWLRSS